MGKKKGKAKNKKDKLQLAIKIAQLIAYIFLALRNALGIIFDIINWN